MRLRHLGRASSWILGYWVGVVAIALAWAGCSSGGINGGGTGGIVTGTKIDATASGGGPAGTGGGLGLDGPPVPDTSWGAGGTGGSGGGLVLDATVVVDTPLGPGGAGGSSGQAVDSGGGALGVSEAGAASVDTNASGGADVDSADVVGQVLDANILDAFAAGSGGNSGGAGIDGSAGGTGGPLDAGPPVPVPAACLTTIRCVRAIAVTPCPSGYDCNDTLSPPVCTLLYCLPEGSSCAAPWQCEQGLDCVYPGQGASNLCSRPNP